MSIQKIKEEIELIISGNLMDLTEGHLNTDGTWSSGDKLISQLVNLFATKLREERARTIDLIHPRLYALWANIDFVVNGSARRQAKELLEYLTALKQREER